MPPASANLRYQSPLEQVTQLIKTQQFYWFLGHVFAILFFVVSLITGFFRPSSSLHYYRFSLLSIIVTYLIVIKQIYFKTRFNFATSGARLLRDENVQYLSLALVLYLSSFVIGQTGSSLYSFIIFAVFHTLTYFQNHLLPVFVGELATQQRISGAITNFTSKFNQPALFAAANAEIILLLITGIQLIPSALFLLYKWNLGFFAVQVFVFATIVLRFDSNQYTKTVVEQMDLKVSQTLVQLNRPQLSQVYHNIRNNAIKYLSLIQLPKDASKNK
ncbi:POM33 Nucleoporin POM33 [Candida maltosa Xu316]